METDEAGTWDRNNPALSSPSLQDLPDAFPRDAELAPNLGERHRFAEVDDTLIPLATMRRVLADLHEAPTGRAHVQRFPARSDGYTVKRFQGHLRLIRF